MAMAPDLVVEFDWASPPFVDFPAWLDESQYLKSVSGGYGASGDGDQAQAGSFTIVLDNSTGRFDPLWNPREPSRKVRVRSTVSPVRTLLTGWIDSIEITHGVGYSEATISCIDGIGMLSAEELPPSLYDYVVGTVDVPTRWYRMSEPPTDSKLTDSSTNLVHGTWTSAGVAVDALAPDGGSARAFGATGRAVVAGQPLTSTTWSIELWADATDTTGLGAAAVPLVMIGDGTSSKIQIDWWTGNRSVWLSVFATASNSTYTFLAPNDAAQTSSPVLSAGPHHIMATRSGATISLHIDGSLTQTATIVGTVAAPGAGVVIGGLADARGSADAGFYNSHSTPEFSIDDVALYHGVTKSLARALVHYNAGQPVLASQRVTDVLNAVDWPTLKRDINTSTTWLSAGSWGGTAGGHLADVAATEQGRFFVDGDGVAKFHSVSRQFTVVLPAGAQLTASDAVGAATPYAALDLSSRRSTVANYSVAPRDGGVGGFAESASSITNHRRLTVSTPSLHSTDLAAQNLAEWVLERRYLADYRPMRVVFLPNASEMAAVLTPNIGDWIEVQQDPPPGTFTNTWTMHLEGLDYAFDVTNQTARITYRLDQIRAQPIPIDGWGLWDVGRWDLAAWAI